VAPRKGLIGNYGLTSVQVRRGGASWYVDRFPDASLDASDHRAFVNIRSLPSAVVAALCFTACNRTDTKPSAVPMARGSIAIVNLAEDPRYSFLALASGLPHATRQIIRDEKEWNDFWEYVTRSGSPGTARPNIDFQHEQVLVAALGPQQAGHDIKITGARVHGDTLYADVTSRARIPGACLTDEMNSPLAVVVVKRTRGPVLFTEHQVDLGCPY